jgi:predicted TIM-barrel fold metal-dependent hydrolase
VTGAAARPARPGGRAVVARLYLPGLLALAAGLAAGTAGAAPASAAARYYTLEDFRRVEKIDAHVHLHGAADRFMRQAIEDHFRILTINVDYPDYPPIAAQERAAVSLRERYPGRVAFAVTFSVAGFGSSGWSEATLRELEAELSQGAVGVKVWKNIGMALRDTDGSYVMPDDARLEPVFARLERDRVVLLGHQAEPLNCWLPFENMTIRGDREYFRAHPQYYMYQHPEMPSHEAILAARDRMLRAHPRLRFDAVHLASLEWDVDRVAGFLDRFPNADVDVAARLVHLEYQAVSRREKVRRFLIRYQDRILYGSDTAYGPDDSDPAAIAALHTDWLADWRFLVTSELMHSEDFDTPFRGLHLPRDVVEKIYRRNAETLFAKAWSASPESPGLKAATSH